MPRQPRPNSYHVERRWQAKYGGKSRVCAQENCTTILNAYNRNECCSVHHFAFVIKHKIKVGIGTQAT